MVPVLLMYILHFAVAFTREFLKVQAHAIGYDVPVEN